jgi:hypothetical protein
MTEEISIECKWSSKTQEMARVERDDEKRSKKTCFESAAFFEGS